jgi:outer membrane protein assembly factor BamB
VTAADVRVENLDRKEFSGTERVLCLDEKTGRQLWKHEYPVKYTVSYPAGPRCTPTVHDGKVYALGAEGNLYCLDAAGGQVVWSKDLKAEYKVKTPLWGYAAHPLIDGRKLITLAGGEGSHVVALDKDTGKEIWKAGAQPEPGYAPVLITEAGGVRQLIAAGPTAVRSYDPETGKQHWTTPYEATQGCIIMTPARSGEFLFVGGYEHKNLLLKLAGGKPGVEVVWKDKKGHGISPVNVQPFVEGGVMYGYDEEGGLFGVELPSGKRLWESGGPVGEKPVYCGAAFIVKQADRFWFFAETGHLVIGKLTPRGYEEIDRAKLLDPTYAAYGRKVVWCPPAFANKRVYVRNDKELIAVELGK